MRDSHHPPRHAQSVHGHVRLLSQLLRADPRHHRFLACGLLLRGDVTVSDVQRNLARLRPQVELAHWNPDGFKTGLCAAQPIGQPHSLLALSNNCCMAGVLRELCARFNKLYKRVPFMCLIR